MADAPLILTGAVDGRDHAGAGGVAVNGESIPVTYDRYGRMQYHPAYHARHRQPWTTSEQRYLIENYVSDGPEAVSFALERTIHTIMTRVYELRCRDVMPTPEKLVFHRRIRREKAWVTLADIKR